MLEKAISYVKFLQLQVKVCDLKPFLLSNPRPQIIENVYMTFFFFWFQVLATDEFWPVQGGKAPDISQVKDAIDAILCSQRDTDTDSSSK